LKQLVNALRQVPQQTKLDKPIINFLADKPREINSLENQKATTAFDYSYLKSQFGDAYKDIFDQIAPSFLEHAYAELEQLEEYAHQGNSDKVRRLSHSMKGASNSIGLSKLAELLLGIEDSPDSKDVIEKVSQLRSRMETLKPIIKLEIGHD